MLIACQAWEGMYQGLHGIEALEVLEVKDEETALKELNEWGNVESEELIYSYGLEDEYFDECEEDGCEYDITDSVCWCDRGWRGFMIKEGSFESEREADEELCKLGWDLFIKQYGEKEIG